MGICMGNDEYQMDERYVPIYRCLRSILDQSGGVDRSRWGDNGEYTLKDIVDQMGRGEKPGVEYLSAIHNALDRRARLRRQPLSAEETTPFINAFLKTFSRG